MERLLLFFSAIFWVIESCAGDRAFSTLCSLRNEQKWSKNDSHQFIKDWLRSAQVDGLSTSHTIQLHSFGNTTVIDLITELEDGSPKGKGWKIAAHYEHERIFHSGYLYGTLDSSSKMTGSDIVYVYPDFKTALVGIFSKDVMIEAREAKIIAHKCRDGILDIKITSPNSAARPVFAYDPPASFFRISKTPTVRDPMEAKNIFIKVGDHGDAMWAKRDFEPNDVIAYYNGLWYEKKFINWSNMTDDEMWAFHKNLIGMDDVWDMNIPQEYWRLEKYRATLGHKVNHSFTKANTWFGSAHHPRFGRVRTITALSPIKKNEECLIDYQYSIKDNVPLWYKHAYVQEVGLIPP